MEFKKSPVDRDKLLITLECCREPGVKKCAECPSRPESYCSQRISTDALAYIGWLEEKVEALEKETLPEAPFILISKKKRIIEGKPNDVAALSVLGVAIVNKLIREAEHKSLARLLTRKTKMLLLPWSNVWKLSIDEE